MPTWALSGCELALVWLSDEEKEPTHVTKTLASVV